MARTSTCGSQVRERAGMSGPAGVVADTAPTACRTASSRSRTSVQPGGGAVGPPGPSKRMTAWKWTPPRRWCSATLAIVKRRRR